MGPFPSSGRYQDSGTGHEWGGQWTGGPTKRLSGASRCSVTGVEESDSDITTGTWGGRKSWTGERDVIKKVSHITVLYDVQKV